MTEATATTGTAIRPPRSRRTGTRRQSHPAQAPRPTKQVPRTRSTRSLTRSARSRFQNPSSDQLGLEGQTTAYSYDPAGNVLTREDPNGATATNTYTPVNQIATTSYSGSSAPSVSFDYDANGNRVSMSDEPATRSYGNTTPSTNSRLRERSKPGPQGQADSNGDITGIAYPLGSGASWASTDTISYGYDNASELNSVTDFNGNLVSISNSADGLASAPLGFDWRHDQHYRRPDGHTVRSHARKRLDDSSISPAMFLQALSLSETETPSRAARRPNTAPTR